MVERACRTCGNAKRAASDATTSGRAGWSNSGHSSAAGRAKAAESRRQTGTKTGPARAQSERRVIDARKRGARIDIYASPARTVALAQSFRLVHRVRDAVADLQRRNGDKQKRWTRCARLADHVWLQYVFVSSLEMDWRRLLRTHAPFDRFDRG